MIVCRLSVRCKLVGDTFKQMKVCLPSFHIHSYGDVTAVTLEEKMFSCVVMVTGICVFMAMALGGMASVVTTFDQQRATYLHKYTVIVKHLVRFMENTPVQFDQNFIS